jgi:hypothetical protein
MIRGLILGYGSGGVQRAVQVRVRGLYWLLLVFFFIILGVLFHGWGY